MEHQETVYKKWVDMMFMKTQKEVTKNQRVLKKAREGRVSRKQD